MTSRSLAASFKFVNSHPGIITKTLKKRTYVLARTLARETELCCFLEVPKRESKKIVWQAFLLVD
jgi:hypothetical protein